jgi:hypothetical protein
MNKKEILKEINIQKWIFAKTYAKTAPHEYITRKSNPKFFDNVCGLIDKEGYNKKWRDGKEYTYLKILDYKYWHFDIILNREKVKYIHKKGYKIPEDLDEIIRKRDKLCVYCHKLMKELPRAIGTPHNKATVEHLDDNSVNNPEEWNVAMCCGSCNSSRQKGNENWNYWFNSEYCKERGITKLKVAQFVKDYWKMVGENENGE